MASLPSVLCAMDARKCVCDCVDLSNAAVGFERIVSRHKRREYGQKREEKRREKTDRGDLCPDTMRRRWANLSRLSLRQGSN